MRKIHKILTGAVYAVVVLAFPATTFASTLSLSPSSGTVNKGCDLNVAINLDTQGVQTDGTDAILLFDKNVFTGKTINSGTIYPDYPGNAIDNTNGKITVSGLASVSQAYTGSGTLATVVFTVNPAAVTSSSAITFDFDPADLSKTTDSNIVQRSTILDTLSSVTNGSYTIGTGACTSTGTTSTVAPGGTTTILTGSGTSQGSTVAPTGTQKTVLDNTALEGPALVFSILGGFLVVVGVIGLALL